MVSERRFNAGYAFSGHQTFPFRYPWLPKGVQHLSERPDLFTRDDAFVILGVGKHRSRRTSSDTPA